MKDEICKLGGPNQITSVKIGNNEQQIWFFDDFSLFLWQGITPTPTVVL
jgi:hypothetical protein